MTYGWDQVIAMLAAKPAGTRIRFEPHMVAHPLDAGFRRSIGLPAGQRSDFRLTLPDCRGLHVQDFGTHYEAHLDRTDPECDALLHLQKDAAGAYVAGATALGALFGLLIGKRPEAVLVGALIGGVVGGISAVAAEQAAQPQPPSSERARR